MRVPAPSPGAIRPRPPHNPCSPPRQPPPNPYRRSSANRLRITRTITRVTNRNTGRGVNRVKLITNQATTPGTIIARPRCNPSIPARAHCSALISMNDGIDTPNGFSAISSNSVATGPGQS